MSEDAVFEELTSAMTAGGIEATLGRLADEMRGLGRFHELFEVRLMQARHRLGLRAAQGGSLDELPEPARSAMEQAYLEACREVGALLLDASRLREAWLYLRPTGDKALLAPRLSELAQDESQRQNVIEIALYEGVAPRLGFELVLAQYGICNAITLFDSQMHSQPREARASVASLLVHRLYDDLVRNLRAEIERRQGAAPAETTLVDLVASRDWLFENLDYHIDTSHLSAVVRFALVLDDPAGLRLAWELTEYGRRLAAQYQYAGSEPFVEAYPSYALFFRALLGEDVDRAIAHFEGRARALAGADSGQAAAEVYVGLLSRLGRHTEALAAAVELHSGEKSPLAFAPPMIELARRAGDFQSLLRACRRRGDLLGFGAALVESATPA